MRARHGEVDGLRMTELAIQRRAARTGGTWNPELTRAWYLRVCSAVQGTRSFDGFMSRNGDLLGPLCSSG